MNDVCVLNLMRTLSGTESLEWGSEMLKEPPEGQLLKMDVKCGTLRSDTLMW